MPFLPSSFFPCSTCLSSFHSHFVCPFLCLSLHCSVIPNSHICVGTSESRTYRKRAMQGKAREGKEREKELLHVILREVEQDLACVFSSSAPLSGLLLTFSIISFPFVFSLSFVALSLSLSLSLPLSLFGCAALTRPFRPTDRPNLSTDHPNRPAAGRGGPVGSGADRAERRLGFCTRSRCQSGGEAATCDQVRGPRDGQRGAEEPVLQRHRPVEATGTPAGGGPWGRAPNRKIP
mmetsp:Transcript_45886/g.90394  ORF Transcript_45886/g.90394 Transcript_45886/m.90394 type:complete len:235 (-) Transcript_45886:930-1634(-)